MVAHTGAQMLVSFKWLEASSFLWVSQLVWRAPRLTQWGQESVQGGFCICCLLRVE